MITETGTPSRPTTITASFFGYLLSTLASVIAGVILLGSRQQLVDALRKANDTNTGNRLTEDQIQHAASLGQTTAIVVVVLFALVYLLLAFRLRAGRNWARIVLTVFVAFQVISLVTLQGTSAVSYISTGISVIATVLAYLPDSNAYLRGVKRAQ
ncbi:hypothetical protein [Amycolatopsis pigmentata]|uniref:Uncharacterized protein n=1 Tax=Amycolatopsis pigmentata TaxID=450801 RepID=A0ABW5G0M9_9PSEU